jgi:hypothetical protein
VQTGNGDNGPAAERASFKTEVDGRSSLRLKLRLRLSFTAVGAGCGHIIMWQKMTEGRRSSKGRRQTAGSLVSRRNTTTLFRSSSFTDSSPLLLIGRSVCYPHSATVSRLRTLRIPIDLVQDQVSTWRTGIILTGDDAVLPARRPPSKHAVCLLCNPA